MREIGGLNLISGTKCATSMERERKVPLKKEEDEKRMVALSSQDRDCKIMRKEGDFSQARHCNPSCTGENGRRRGKRRRIKRVMTRGKGS